METAIDFTKKSFVIITGASQGIGQKIAEVIANKIPSTSTIILVARSENGLSETRSIIMAVNPHIRVELHGRDLSRPDIEDFDLIFDTILTQKNLYENAIIFHNAGQVGLLANTTELNDLQTWRSYYDLNLFSATLLNSVFITKCKQYIPKLYVINISSLCGHKPFKNLALYGSAKAARDLYFSVLAVEEPAVTVLRYCPGPVLTAMFNNIKDNAQDANVRSDFKSMVDNNVVLTTEQTVSKLFGLLESGKFASGDLIDYFD